MPFRYLRALLSRRLWGWLCGLGLLLGTGVPGRALSVIPPSFPQLVEKSSQVARLKVERVYSRWDVTPQGSVIRTYVECRNLRTLKGSDDAVVTLRFLGGQVGNDAMTIADMPTLEEGGTYVVFLSENGRAFCPLVSAQHGLYPIVVDPTNQEEYVTRSNGQRLRAVDDVETPIIAQSAHPALRLAAGAGLTLQEFEAAITSEIARTAVKAIQ